jgi:hypothetical protein
MDGMTKSSASEICAPLQARLWRQEHGLSGFPSGISPAKSGKDAILIPKFVDGRATTVRVSCIEDLQQVPFNHLLDWLFHLVFLCFD